MSDREKIDPSKLTPQQTAEVLTRFGEVAVDADSVEDDQADGAPTNADGSLNAMRYVAWLVRELACVSD
jgi:hypothetical protein